MIKYAEISLIRKDFDMILSIVYACIVAVLLGTLIVAEGTDSFFSGFFCVLAIISVQIFSMDKIKDEGFRKFTKVPLIIGVFVFSLTIWIHNI